MLLTLIKMVKIAVVMGIMVGLLMFADSNLANMKLFTKILMLVVVLSAAAFFINAIGLKTLIIPVLLFLVMSTISGIGLFMAITTKKILEMMTKER